MPRPGTKQKELFERVLNAVNRERGEQGGGVLPYEKLKDILKAEGIDGKAWDNARQRARVMTPNLYELLYRAFGREVPPARGLRLGAVEEAPSEDEAGEEPPEEPTTTDILTSVLAWLDKLEPDDRRRVLATATRYYET